MSERAVVNTRGLAVDESEVRRFVGSLGGDVIRPGDAEYEASRKVWNGMIDRHPSMIVRCGGVADVMNAVVFARTNDILVSIRGGGHNVAGNAVCDGGMVIDLSRRKGIRVNPGKETARCEGGVTWGEFDREAQIHGLATTGGIVSSTGIAGFTLGGGIGWLMRKYGLTCDNLLSADIVTADGKFLIASSGENADLYWAIRGGGGNFGVVTSFKYLVHPVGPVTGGIVFYPFERAREVLRFYRDYVAGIPDGLSTMVAFSLARQGPYLPAEVRGKPLVALVLCHAGPPEEGAKAVGPLRDIVRPVADLISVMPYTRLQSMLDADAPAGLLNYWKSEYLKAISDEAIEVVLDYAARLSSPLSQIHLQHLGGAVGSVGEDETAFGRRTASFVMNIVSKWRKTAESEGHIRWTRELAAAMRPFATGGVYVNFLGEEGDDRVKAAYGPETYRRLALLKERYDPTNFFRMNQNIRPAE